MVLCISAGILLAAVIPLRATRRVKSQLLRASLKGSLLAEVVER
jgi:hypothetical protein